MFTQTNKETGLKTHYCGTAVGPIGCIEFAKSIYGDDVMTGYPGAPFTVAPYSDATHEIIGFVAMHRSGPSIPVIRRKK